MVTVLNTTLVGVVCKDRLDFQRWVSNQGYDELRKYVPVTNVSDAHKKFDELVVTTTASANPEFVDIYIKLNGAYNKARREVK
jgi:hypothetical protein